MQNDNSEPPQKREIRRKFINQLIDVEATILYRYKRETVESKKAKLSEKLSETRRQLDLLSSVG